MRMEVAYNNNSEIELEDSNTATAGELASSLYPIGIRVAQKFDGYEGELVWFEGVVERFDEEEGLYRVLYSDSASEGMEESEVSDAVQNHRVHVRQQEEISAAAETAATGSNSLHNGVDSDIVATPAAKDGALSIADALVANFEQSLSNLDASEITAAMRAMTAAAEGLASAATRIEAAVQTVQILQSQQQQQQLFTLPPWQLHHSWQHVMLQQPTPRVSSTTANVELAAVVAVTKVE